MRIFEYLQYLSSIALISVCFWLLLNRKKAAKKMQQSDEYNIEEIRWFMVRETREFMFIFAAIVAKVCLGIVGAREEDTRIEQKYDYYGFIFFTVIALADFLASRIKK